jgi:hypothetical protein
MEVWQVKKAISGSTQPVMERGADRDAAVAVDRHPIRARPPGEQEIWVFSMFFDEFLTRRYLPFRLRLATTVRISVRHRVEKFRSV